MNLPARLSMGWRQRCAEWALLPIQEARHQAVIGTLVILLLVGTLTALTLVVGPEMLTWPPLPLFTVTGIFGGLTGSLFGRAAMAWLDGWQATARQSTTAEQWNALILNNTLNKTVPDAPLKVPRHRF